MRRLVCAAVEDHPAPTVWSQDEPLRTITSAPGFAQIVPILTECANASGQRIFAPQEPLRTQCSEVKGGHFALASAHITKFRTGSTGSDLAEPLPTITAGPKENPAGAAHALGLVSATLIQTGYGEGPGQQPRVPGLDKPLGTVVAGGAKHAAVAAFLAKHYSGDETPGSSLAKPVDTITSVDHNALVAAHVVRHFGQSVGSVVEEPIGTICAGGMGKTGVVASHLSKLYGTTTGADPREPMHTVTGGGNHIAEVRAFLIKYYGEGGQDQDCREPMHTIPTRDRLGVVTIHGKDYVITDIGMRMLEPHELYAAQGFPPGYQIAPTVAGRRLPKHAQVRMCGNSVCPPLAAAIVAANVPVAQPEELAA